MERAVASNRSGWDATQSLKREGMYDPPPPHHWWFPLLFNLSFFTCISRMFWSLFHCKKSTFFSSFCSWYFSFLILS